MNTTKWSAAMTLVLALAAPATAADAGPSQSVVVLAGSESAAAQAVSSAGGTVERSLPSIGAVVATVPSSRLGRINAANATVVADLPVALTAGDFGPSTNAAVAAMNPDPAWGDDAGRGVGVALVDTGVAPHPALAGRIAHSVDLTDEADGVDRYGHGTFMAGLIASAAPGADIVSVKVGGADGSTTLADVLAGIDWVVEHADEHNVRVLSLSFGVDMPMAWQADPLSAAVEAAWASGITVVTSSGNDGQGTVTAPGRDPWVLTVGATDSQGTVSSADDTVPAFSGSGRVPPHAAKPEVVAPGVDVVSLRAPGSFLDTAYPAARIGDDGFRGSGTSMSAALTAGAAAVLTWGHPDATPDDVKGALVASAASIADGNGTARAVDLDAAMDSAADEAWQQFRPVHGGNGDEVVGMPWTATRWSATRWSATRWSATRWSATRWSGTRWSGTRWSGTRWSGTRWSGTRWSGTRWSAAAWG